MKKIFAFLYMMICLCVSVMAEETNYVLYVQMVDGTNYECHVNDISKVSFDENEVVVVLQDEDKMFFESSEVACFSFSDKDGKQPNSVNNISDRKTADDRIYTLDGKLVKNTDNLPSGVYIKNGKKYYVVR